MLYSDYQNHLFLLVVMFACLGTPEYVWLTWSSMAALLAKQSTVSSIVTSLILGWAPQPANSWASLCLRRRTIPCCVCSEMKMSTCIEVRVRHTSKLLQYSTAGLQPRPPLLMQKSHWGIASYAHHCISCVDIQCQLVGKLCDPDSHRYVHVVGQLSNYTGLVENISFTSSCHFCLCLCVYSSFFVYVRAFSLCVCMCVCVCSEQSLLILFDHWGQFSVEWDNHLFWAPATLS